MEEKMLKRLRIKITAVKSQTVLLKIVEQSHRNEQFGEDGHNAWSKSANDVTLASYSYPDEGDPFYVRGDDRNSDAKTIHVPKGSFKGVLHAILGYNQFYNKNKLLMKDVVEGLCKWEK